MTTTTLAAGAQKTIEVSGRYVYVVSASGAFRMALQILRGKETRLVDADYSPNDLIELERDEKVKQITISNTSGASNTIVLRVSDLKVTPADAGTSVSVAGTVTVTGPLTDTALRAAPVPVEIRATASGGADRKRIITTASTNADFAKASPGKVLSINGTNTSAGVLYLKLFNATAAPTVGTDVPVETYALPVGAFSFEFGDTGVAFATGIAFAITGLIADNDTTVTAAGDVVAQIHFK
jgi:hypothetical protein